VTAILASTDGSVKLSRMIQSQSRLAVGLTLTLEALAKPLWGVCKRGVRIQESGVRIIVHVARERVPVLNTEFWLLNTARAEPTKEVLHAPPWVNDGG